MNDLILKRMAEIKDDLSRYKLEVVTEITKELLNNNKSMVLNNYKEDHVFSDGDTVYINSAFWQAISNALSLNYSEAKDILNSAFYMIIGKEINCIKI